MEVMDDASELLITLSATQRATNLALTADELHVISIDTTPRSWKSTLLCQAPEPAHKKFPYLNVLHAVIREAAGLFIVDIKVLALKGHEGVVTISGSIEADRASAAEKWVETLMRNAYSESQRHKRLRVLVNPFSGPGKTRSQWTKHMEPIFRSAKCDLDVTFTERVGHGKEIAEALDIDSYDGLIVFSGDGLIYEAINGLASRKDGLRALSQCPIGVIPGGSGNAMSCSLNGPKLGTNQGYAALTIIKGHPKKIDICSITQQDKRFYSFCSQAYGLMADVDLGTEHLRWMGGQRFIVGFIQRALAGPHYECEISMRIVEADKHVMKQAVLEQRKAAPSISLTKTPTATTLVGSSTESKDPSQADATTSHEMPALRFGTIADPLPASPDSSPPLHSKASGWTTVNAPICFMYAGTIPWLADNLLQFPIAKSDGDIVMSILPVVSSTTLLTAIDGTELGKHYDHTKMEYYKVEAYRLTPKPSKGRFPRFISIDGEHTPFEPFQVEPHAGIGRVFSLQEDWYLPPQWLNS